MPENPRPETTTAPDKRESCPPGSAETPAGTAGRSRGVTRDPQTSPPALEPFPYPTRYPSRRRRRGIYGRPGSGWRRGGPEPVAAVLAHAMQSLRTEGGQL